MSALPEAFTHSVEHDGGGHGDAFAKTGERDGLQTVGRVDGPGERMDYAAGQWSEDKHPRDADGKFASGSGGGGSSSGSGDKPAAPKKKPKPVGSQHVLAGKLANLARKYGATNPEGTETIHRYKQADGSYSPKRAALHKEIIDRATKDAKPVPAGETPILIFKGGGPAAGKSSLEDTGVLVLPQNHALVDPDWCKGQLPEYQEMTGAGDETAASFAHEESSDLGKALMTHALKQRYHTVLDTTGDSGYDKLAKKVAEAKAAGHQVNAEYVTLSTDEAVNRAKIRAGTSGRHVPEGYIRETHRNVSQIVGQAAENGLFDNLRVWDNEVPRGEKPILIAEGKGKDLKIHQPDLWQKFLDKGKETWTPTD